MISKLRLRFFFISHFIYQWLSWFIFSKSNNPNLLCKCVRWPIRTYVLQLLFSLFLNLLIVKLNVWFVKCQKKKKKMSKVRLFNHVLFFIFHSADMFSSSSEGIRLIHCEDKKYKNAPWWREGVKQLDSPAWWQQIHAHTVCILNDDRTQ